MKVALVHDYVGEFGGAERVLEALSQIWPEAPIYTAFARKGPALERFKGNPQRKIIVSWAHYIPFFATKLHSPLRFLAPLIWKSFVRQLADYDIVISSASWFVTKGFGSRGKGEGERVKGKRIEFCYCHTPPRWLYGYETPYASKNTLVRAYVALVAHFIRMYDFWAAQRVDYFIANSKNVQARIKKFYRRDSVVIYPPVDTPNELRVTSHKSRDYYLVVSRITGGKGLEMAVQAGNKLKLPLKIVGSPSGYSQTYEWIKKHAGPTVELLGYVEDRELAELYAGAKAFLAVAKDEDFGMTTVEAMSQGTPVIAYNGGGYRETVKDKETGVLFDDYSVDGLIKAIRKLDTLKIKPEDCVKQARKFSKERFKKRIKEFVEEKWVSHDDSVTRNGRSCSRFLH